MSVLLNSDRDVSGRLEIAVYMERAPHPQQHFKDFAVEVDDPDMVVVGGGGVGDGAVGAFLTASYPRDDLRAWLVSSKDHLHPVPHHLVGYAIGLKVVGKSREDLIKYIHVHASSSEVVPHPEVYAPVNAANPNEICLGGGFKVHWTGAGSLATRSRPDSEPGSDGWRTRAKDHVIQSPAYITTYAIGLHNLLVFATRTGITVLSISRIKQEAGSAIEPHPQATAWLDSEHVLTGGGADVIWHGGGNLLWKLEPVIETTGTVMAHMQTRFGFRAASKDHDVPDPSKIVTYAIGIKAQPVD